MQKEVPMSVYFAQSMLKTKNEEIKGKTVVVSGSGNVAQYACEKATEIGGKVVTMSDSSGYIYDEDGITPEKLAFIMDIKNVKRGRISLFQWKHKGLVGRKLRDCSNKR